MTANTSYYKIIDQEFEAAKAYHFVITNKAPVALVTAMSFTQSGKSLKADTAVGDPMSPDSKIQVVAVLDRVKWVGGAIDPIEIVGRLSPENRAVLQEALTAKTGGASVEINFDVYEFDPKAKKYFKRFTSDGKEIKFVFTKGSQVYVGEKPDMVVQDPENFQFEMSLTGKPEGAQQDLVCAFVDGGNFVREIGTVKS